MKQLLYTFVFLIILTCLCTASLYSLPVSEIKGFNTELFDSLNSTDNIYFDFGKYELKPESFEVLDGLAKELLESSGVQIEVIGHTDDIGSDGFNFSLSLKRAETVKNYLVSKGCNPEQIIAGGKGKQELLNKNFTETERAINRRVEFKWNIPVVKVDSKDIEYVNSNIRKTSRAEIEGEISARDTAGEPITDIQEKDISAFLKWKEDSTAGTVHFLPIDDNKKTAFTLVLDYSPSMFGTNSADRKNPKGKKIELMEAAVKGFIEALGSNTFLKIVKFGSQIEVIQPYTKSKEIMYKAVELKSNPRPGTALFAAIYSAIKDTLYDSNPTIMKTVIAFTDGMDNASGRITKDTIYMQSDRKAIKVYTIGLLDINDENSSYEERCKGEKDLKEISAVTGSFFYHAKDPESLSNIYKQIFNQIKNSYKISVKWNADKLPPKGTNVTACITINIKGKTRTFYKDYVME